MLNSKKKEESIVGGFFSLIARGSFLLIFFGTAVLGLIIYLALAGGSLVLVSWLGWLAAKKAISIVGGFTFITILLILMGVGSICAYFDCPKCPNCKKARLFKRGKRVIDEYFMPGGAGKLYYGMRSITKVAIWETTYSCWRCGYKIRRLKEAYGSGLRLRLGP